MKNQSRRFLLKNGLTEGILRSHFFKDMAVQGGYRYVLISFYPSAVR